MRMYEGFASYKNRGLVVFIDLLRSVESIHNIDANVGKEIAHVAKGSLDISKPILLQGLRFSRVTSKAQWMNRTYDNSGLPKYPANKEGLLSISDPTIFALSNRVQLDFSLGMYTR